MKKAVLIGVAAGFMTLFLLGAIFDVLPDSNGGQAAIWTALVAPIAAMFAMRDHKGCDRCIFRRKRTDTSDPADADPTNPYARPTD